MRIRMSCCVCPKGILIPRGSSITATTYCDHGGSECTLPFTGLHCGGKVCADCRLPPSHDCTRIGSWNAKPRPAGGMNYSRGGGVTATGGIAPESRDKPEKRTGDGLPYLMVLGITVVLVLAGLAWLAVNGY